MQYEMIGTTLPAVEFTLAANEAVYNQKGAMAWQSAGIDMKTNARGGLGKSLGRMFMGESIFMNTYTALRDGEKIAFSSTVPGKIMPIDLTNTPGFIAQKGAFLCAQPQVQIKIAFTKRLSAGVFGGEGLILQDLTGNGMVFLEVDGDLVERTLAPGEVIKVSTGNVVAFEKTVNYEVETVKGLGNIFFGGEGLFLTKLTGPGRIILQTMNFSNFVGQIASTLPTKSS